MYSTVSLLRAVPDPDPSIIFGSFWIPVRKTVCFTFQFFIAFFQFRRTAHCFRVILKEGLGAPVHSGWRKGLPRRPCPQQPAKRLAAPRLSPAAGEEARRTAPVHSGRRKGAAPPLRWRRWTTQATLESSVETVKAGSPDVNW
jgi:hypothetical protein